MQPLRLLALIAVVVVALPGAFAADGAAPKGRLLARMNWVEARSALTPQTVVVIPLGAESKEHGPHLPLDTDFRQAEYFKQRVLAAADVVIAPTLNYGFYPAFVEYPGSTSLSLAVSRDMLVEIVRGIARFGPRRFYVINIGVSTNRTLAQARALLELEGIALAYLDLTGPTVRALERVGGNPAGRHPCRRDRDLGHVGHRRDRGRHAQGRGRVHGREGQFPGAVLARPKTPSTTPAASTATPRALPLPRAASSTME